MSEKYSFEHFNRHGVLKIGVALLAILMLLTNHYWIGLATLMSRSPELMASVLDGTHKYYLLAEFPAVLVAAAAVFRKPDAGRWAMVIWRFGLPLLVVSALGTAVLRFGGSKFRFNPNILEAPDFVLIGATFAAAGYLLFAPRARRVFKEFPAPPAEDKPSSAVR